jgi:hypothetical protein
MTNYRNIEGLTQAGRTDQTNLIAAACRTDSDTRKALVAALLAFDKEVTHSNQDMDRQAALSDILANAARSGFGA